MEFRDKKRRYNLEMTEKPTPNIRDHTPKKKAKDPVAEPAKNAPKKKRLHSRLHNFCWWLVRETLVIASAVLVLGILFLSWKLSQGPLPLNFATPYLERAFHKHYPDMTIKIGKTALVWQPNDDALSLRIYDISLKENDKPILAMSKTDIGISKRDLLIGGLKVKSISLSSLAFLVTKNEDGTLQLSFHEQSENKEEQENYSFNLPKPAAENANGNDLKIFEKLKSFSLKNADVIYHDKSNNTEWHASNVNILLSRSSERISGSIGTSLILDKEQQQTAQLNTNIFFDENEKTLRTTTFFTDFNLKFLQSKFPDISSLDIADIPLTGKLDVYFNTSLQPEVIKADIRSKAGEFNLKDIYKKPLHLKDIKTEISFSKKDHRIDIPQISFSFEDTPSVSASGHFTLPHGDEMAGDFAAKAVLKDFPLDILKHYWPEALAPEPRKWVTNNLSVGIADSASLNIAADLTMKDGKISLKKMQDLTGDITFHNVTVDYLPDLPKVTGANGSAHYTANDFDIKAQGGKVMDMDVESGHVQILDIVKKPKINIVTKVKGPLKTALHIIDQKPLEYARMFNINGQDISGETDVDLTLDFPLYTGLSVSDIKVITDATLTNVKMPKFIKQYDLNGGPFKLHVNNSAMSVTGAGTLDNAPLTFNWQNNFSKDTDFQQRAQGDISIPPAMFKTFFPVPKEYANVTFSTLPAKFTYTTMHNNPNSKLFLSADLLKSDVKIPPLDYRKAPQKKGQVDLFLHMDKNKQPNKISSLLISLPNLRAEGGLTLRPDKGNSITVNSADIENFIMGNTKFSAQVKNHKNKIPRIHITGPYIDASSLLEKSKKEAKQKKKKRNKAPFEVTIDAGRLSLEKGKHLDEVKLFLRQDGKGLTDQLEIDAVAGKAPIYFRYLPEGKGHSLRFESNNAGAALAGLGISKSIKGGKIVIHGVPVPNGGKYDVTGRIMLSNFTVIDMPVLARLLNALSPTGLQDLLAGDGIYFSRMKSDFLWTKKFTSNLQDDIVETITVRKGQTSGSSLGLTFDGDIDQTNNIVDINGTIVPISQLNKAIGEIPLIGDILTGGSNAVFAATYKIKGPKDKLSVTVNPLATLAPGVLRKLFFEEK